ncbi:hypothetical protein AB0C02_21680 [Micromonospora sp. NPDC048999]|uniref:hypothetical protein n=1 Tax=Micromonospora sp. NPDC048999 TaxID=3155391 RepID=UPI0033FC5F3B
MQFVRAGEDLTWASAATLRRRFPPGPDYDQEVWDEQVRQHKPGHLRNERPKVRIQRLV